MAVPIGVAAALRVVLWISYDKHTHTHIHRHANAQQLLYSDYLELSLICLTMK